MKRLLLIVIFILACVGTGFGQSPTPTQVPTVDLGDPVSVIVGKEGRIKRVDIDFSDDGLKASTIRIFAAKGRTTTAVDEDTQLYKFESLETVLIYNGTIDQLLKNITVAAGEQKATEFSVNFIKIFYDPNNDSNLAVQFNSLVKTLMDATVLDLKPATKVQ